MASKVLEAEEITPPAETYSPAIAESQWQEIERRVQFAWGGYRENSFSAEMASAVYGQISASVSRQTPRSSKIFTSVSSIKLFGHDAPAVMPTVTGRLAANKRE